MTRSRTVAAVLVTFFVLGLYAVVTQSLLVREFLVVFFGNELSWGLTFFGWLAGVGLGAAVGGRVSRHERARLNAFVFALAFLAMLVPVLIVVIRIIRGAFDVGPGEYLPLWTMLWLTPLLTAPVSFLIGFAFPLAASLIASENAEADPIAKVYIVEALGSLVGGALFSFVLIELFPSLFLALLMGLVLLIGAQVLNLPRAWRRPLRGLVVPLVLAALVLLFIFQREIDRWSIDRRWQSFHTGTAIVAGSPVDSRYQNITLGRREGQYTVFLDGLAAMTFPDPRDLAVDAHFVMSQAKSIRRVLVIGGGLEGLLAEMLTYPPEHLERLDYVMLDPKLLELVRPHLAERDRAALDDPRLHVHYDDGRRFLREHRDRYDLIYLNTPEPSSILLNRLYTRVFFKLVASRLADDGVFVFTITASPSYFSDMRRQYLGSILRAPFFVPRRDSLRSLVTWGERAFAFHAAGDGVLTTDVAELRRRYAERAPRTDARYALMVDGGDDRLDPDKLEAMRRELETARAVAQPNTDEHPVACLYHLILWDRMTSGSEHSSFAFLEGVRLRDVLVAVAATCVLWLVVARFVLRRSAIESATLLSVASTGFTTMSAEMVLLFWFQSVYGYVYERIGVIVGVFMLGLVVGSLVLRRVVRWKPRFSLWGLPLLDFAICLFAVALPVLCLLLEEELTRAGELGWVFEWQFMGLVLASGLLGGSIYPVAANVLVDQKRHTGRAAGSVDAADHVGACIGALVAGVVLLPALGIIATCLALAALKLLSAVCLVFARPRRPAGKDA